MQTTTSRLWSELLQYDAARVDASSLILRRSDNAKAFPLRHLYRWVIIQAPRHRSGVQEPDTGEPENWICHMAGQNQAEFKPLSVERASVPFSPHNGVRTDMIGEEHVGACRYDASMAQIEMQR
jgi:hypothetical protein